MCYSVQNLKCVCMRRSLLVFAEAHIRFFIVKKVYFFLEYCKTRRQDDNVRTDAFQINLASQCRVIFFVV